MNKILSVLIFIALSYVFIPLSVDLVFLFGLGLVYLCFLIFFLRNGAEISISFLIILGSLLLLILPSFIVKGYNSQYFGLITSIFFGYLVYKFFNDHRFIYKILVFYVFYYVIIFLVKGTLDNIYIIGEAKISRNYITVHLYSILFLYYILSYRNGEIKAQSHLVFFIFLIAILSSGFSSAITALMILFTILLYEKKIKLILSITAICSVVILLLYFNLINLSIWDRFLSYNDTTEISTSRLIIWADFIDNLDSESLLFGYSSSHEFIENIYFSNITYTHNLHNSYLNLYNSIGILSIFFFLFLFWMAYRLYKMHILLFIVFLAILIRSFTDGYLFVTFFVDFIFIYSFFVIKEQNLLSRK